jgi:hypothetical protein
MKNIKANSIIWDFCRTTRLNGGVFEHVVPIVRCKGDVPMLLAIKGFNYTVKFSKDGFATHEWGELYHVDPLSILDKGFEFAIYDKELYVLGGVKIISVAIDGVVRVMEVEIGEPPFVESEISYLKTVRKNKRGIVILVDGGEWEWIRQTVGIDGIYKEKRIKINPGKRYVCINHKSLYDAVLISRDGWEEKIIMNGELKHGG